MNLLEPEAYHTKKGKIQVPKILVIGPYTRSVISFRGELIKEFVRRSYEVYVLAPETGYEKELATIGAEFIRIPLKRNGFNPFTDIRLILFLYKTFNSIKPDKVFLYAIKPVVYGSLAAYYAGVKNIFSMITGLGYVFTGQGLRQKALRLLITRLYRRALAKNKKVFFQNPDDFNLFLNHGLVSADRTVLVNGSGVDLDTYGYTDPLPDPVSFLLIARLIRDKGIVEYIEAAALLKKKYPQVVFKLLGPFDSNPNAIKPEVLDKWLDAGVIEYLGETNDVRPYLAAASVYVLPSYREGTPRSVLEAMSMGRPVITTEAPGCRETVLQGVNGFLVPVKDSAKLAEAMEEFINNPYIIEKMGQKSHELAREKYDVRKINRVILESMGLEAE